MPKSVCGDGGVGALDPPGAHARAKALLPVKEGLRLCLACPVPRWGGG